MEICAGQVCVSAAPTNLVCIRSGNTGPQMQRRNGVKNGIVAKKYVCRSFNNLYASASKKGIKMASEMDIARNMAWLFYASYCPLYFLWRMFFSAGK